MPIARGGCISVTAWGRFAGCGHHRNLRARQGMFTANCWGQCLWRPERAQCVPSPVRDPITRLPPIETAGRLVQASL